jgi:hypothetical protein
MANQNTWGVNVARLKLATMVGRTSDEDEAAAGSAGASASAAADATLSATAFPREGAVADDARSDASTTGREDPRACAAATRVRGARRRGGEKRRGARAVPRRGETAQPRDGDGVEAMAGTSAGVNDATRPTVRG